MHASAAAAQPGTNRTTAPVLPSPPETTTEAGEDPTIDERDVPDYDGRADARPTPGQRLLWIPRILFLPAYVVSEFVLRRPLSFLVTNAEENEIPDKVVQFFTFGPDGNVALAPTFSFDFGFRPNVGLYFRYNDFIREGHFLRAGASTAGLDWVTGSVAYRIAPENAGYDFQMSVGATKRPDGLFFGLGSEASEELRSRYNWVGYDVDTRVGGDLWRGSRIEVGAGVRHRHFGSDVSSDSTSVEDLVADGRLQGLPEGFTDGYTIGYQSARLIIDSRPARPARGTGVRLTGGYELGVDLEGGARSRLWANWGVSAGVHFDMTGVQHVLSLTASIAANEAIRGETPFTELPRLSGNGPMRGFVGRSLSGESEAALLLAYHWPVWGWLDGTAHVAVGNSYDGRFEDFSLGNQRLSFGIGLAAVDQRDHFFEFLVGFGTDEFEDGPDVESIRVLIGGTREF